MSAVSSDRIRIRFWLTRKQKMERDIVDLQRSDADLRRECEGLKRECVGRKGYIKQGEFERIPLYKMNPHVEHMHKINAVNKENISRWKSPKKTPEPTVLP